MNRISASLFVVVLLVSVACNQSPIDIEEPTIVSDEERWMASICSPTFMGRKAGTEGCDSVAVYLQRELNLMGYSVITQPFCLKNSMDLLNFCVEIQGDSDSLIVIGAHYDGAKSGKKYPAADDNGSGVVTLLSLCKYYSDPAHKPHKTLLAGFWAAEEVTLGAAFNGSKYFVKNYSGINRVQYYCNLDCFARKKQGTLFYYSPGFVRAGEIMSEIMSTTDLHGLEFSVKENEKRSSDYMSFYAARIPYFGWNDYDTSGHIHSTDDNIEHISFEQIRAVATMTERLITRL